MLILFKTLFAIGVIVSLFIIFYKDVEDSKDLMMWQQERYGTLLPIKHITGLPNVPFDTTIYLGVKGSQITLVSRNEEHIIKIPTQNIVEFSIQNQSQLEQHVTFGRLLLLGAFAFAAPKKQNVQIPYVVLSYKINNVQIDCLFRALEKEEEQPQDILYLKQRSVYDLPGLINKLKIEQSTENV